MTGRIVQVVEHSLWEQEVAVLTSKPNCPTLSGWLPMKNQVVRRLILSAQCLPHIVVTLTFL